MIQVKMSREKVAAWRRLQEGSWGRRSRVLDGLLHATHHLQADRRYISRSRSKKWRRSSGSKSQAQGRFFHKEPLTAAGQLEEIEHEIIEYGGIRQEACY